MPIQLNETTWKETPKLDPKDRIEVEIGDSKQEDFYPQVKVMRWDNEVNFSARLVTEETAKTASVDAGVIKWAGDTTEAHFYPITEGEGGYEFEVILKEKPKTNVVSFTLNTKELDVIYQPFLKNENPDGSTWEEVDGDRSERPAEINGSYALYYKDNKTGDYSGLGGKNYRAGKFGHIYRPKIKDADGKEIWGELNIKDDLLTITIDQKFLDDAKYPVVVDPTIGLTTVGATAGAFSVDTIRTNSYTTSEAGSAYYLVAYSKYASSQGYWRGVIYNADLSRLTYGSQVTLTTVLKWNYCPITRATLANATVYRIGLWLGVDVSLQYDSGLTMYRDNGQTYHATNAPVDPLVDDTSAANYKLSMYVMYSVTSGTGVDTFGGASGAAGTYTWQAPTGVTAAKVECWGGGGGGTVPNLANRQGGGGGGGAYACGNAVAVTAGNNYTVVVGSAGLGAQYGSATDGGDSTFNSTDVVADGGYASSGGSDGGVGGTTAASTGDVEYAGGDGGDGNQIDGWGSGGGGGCAGKDGVGGTGGDGTSTVGGTGGTGDNGSGGAGGAGGNGGAGTAGTANVLGGGGGGGGDHDFSGAAGGVPGGGGGASTLGAGAGNGAIGQVVITYTIEEAGGGTASWRDVYQVLSNKSQIISENNII